MIIFKDRGAGAKHGPWSHLIQLFFLIEENKTNPFLESTPQALISYLGSQECIGSQPFLDWNTFRATTPLTAWDVFFDRINRTEKDFGTPDVITKILSEDARHFKRNDAKKFDKIQYPLLSAIISRTYQRSELPKEKPRPKPANSILMRNYGNKKTG